MEDQIYIGQSVGSDLMHLEFSYLMNGIKSHAQDGYAQVKKIKVDMLAPSLDEVWNTWLRLKENNSKGLNSLYI